MLGRTRSRGDPNRARFLVFVVTAALMVTASPVVPKDKLRAEELVGKHLESIGSAEARAAVKTRSMKGSASVVFRVGEMGRLTGEGTILSQGRMIRVAMYFGHPAYPGEQHAFDGETVTVGMVKPGQRSNLSEFLHEHGFLLSEGLIGGVVSTGWCLLEAKERGARLQYNGLKKVQGRDLHELLYKPRKGDSLTQITLYFQPDTFRHVMTKCVFRIPAQIGFTPAESSQQMDRYFRVTEEFDNFNLVDGLTIPHQYELTFSYEGQSQTFLTEYSIVAAEVLHNISVNPQMFKIQ